MNIAKSNKDMKNVRKKVKSWQRFENESVVLELSCGHMQYEAWRPKIPKTTICNVCTNIKNNIKKSPL